MTHPAESEFESVPEVELPVELAAAFERIRSSEPSSQSLARVIGRASQMKRRALPDVIVRAPAVLQTPARRNASRLAAGACVAALVMLGLLLNRDRPERHIPVQVAKTGEEATQILHIPTYSSVHITPLIAALFGQLEQDLESADEEWKQVSEAVRLSEIQLEIQATLDRYRDWSD